MLNPSSQSLFEFTSQLIDVGVLPLGHWGLLGLLVQLDELGTYFVCFLLLLMLLLLLLVAVFALELVEFVQTPVFVRVVVLAVLVLALAQQLAQRLDRRVLLVELVPVELDAPQFGQAVLRRLHQRLDARRVDVVVLQPQNLDPTVSARRERLEDPHGAPSAQETVAHAQLPQAGPTLERLRECEGALERERVVLHVEDLEVLTVAQARGDQVRNTLGPDPVLCHLHALDALLVRLVRLGPGGHAAVLESVAAADDALEVGHVLALPPGGFFALGEGDERLGYGRPRDGAHAVVVQDEVFQGHVFGEEVDERVLCVEPERVVAQVYRVEVGAFEQRRQEGRERRGDLLEQSGGEDVVEVGAPEGALGREYGREGFACRHTERVAREVDVCDVGRLLEGCDVFLNVLLGVKFEAFAGERKRFASHDSQFLEEFEMTR